MFSLLTSDGIHLPDLKNGSNVLYSHTSCMQPVW